MQISTTLPDDMVQQIDKVAHRLSRPRGELIQRAIQSYLEDIEDLTLGMERLQDPDDPVLDWEDVKRDLHRSNQG